MADNRLEVKLFRAHSFAEQKACEADKANLDIQLEISKKTMPLGMVGLICGLIPIFSICIADRKSTRLNSSHARISYAVFCLKKKKELWI